MLAHGAGAPMTSPFMKKIAGLIAERGVRVIRFDFAYMAARRATDARRPPPKAEHLIGEYEALAAEVAAGLSNDQRLLIGGKSLGGRVASLAADGLHERGVVAGLVCLGYPFHPPGQPHRLRTQHLERLACPALIIQGERDPFGARAEVEGYPLSPRIRLHWATDGDHDFRPRRATPATQAGNLAEGADAIAAFALAL
jgi:predicted alpha/beta-hydrolase family hydrolase